MHLMQFVPEGYNTSAKIEARGIGTDLAIVSSMIFVAQFLLNLYMGPLMTACGTIVVIIAASILAFLAACSAMTITYFDL
jgi:solute carrier family 45 protein 1/2/4